ncbi:FkbM family methyltransferase [Marinoscillum pacificum]|uniref:FkbM family methyltransferase n=1 Tax=Marinoscillum pacificum TaxID=392723 RepID=UPI00215856BF|nr:FkbM family methyltransferase [Marinoscillum pacificum]
MLKKVVHLWRKHSKRKHQKRFYSQFINNGDLCFDIGANVGAKSDVFLSLGAKVIAAEPQRSCVAYLNKKFASNSNIQILPVAIGSKETMADIHIANVSQISTFSEDFIKAYSEGSPFTWESTEEVQMTRLDSLIEQYGMPKFCKIDVEGFELEVFKGLSYKIPIVSFEYNYKLKSVVLESIDRIEESMEGIYNLVLYENDYFELFNWAEAGKMKHFIRDLDVKSLTGDVYVKPRSNG